MSFYAQAKNKFKLQKVAKDNEKSWCTKCQMKGHHKGSWKCPKGDKDVPNSHKKEFLNFCNLESEN